MDPATVGAVLAGIGAVGNLLGSGSGDLKNSKVGLLMQDRNEALQREFAQMGIQWRVADAEKAGVHPLFALGASGAQYQPQTYVGPSSRSGGAFRSLAAAGQDLSRAMAAMDPEAKELRAMQRQLLQEQIRGLRIKNDEMEAGSMADAFFGPAQVAGDPPGIQTQPYQRGTVDESRVLDVVKPKPDEVISQDSEDRSVTAGRGHAAFQEYQITPWGLKMRLPRSDEGPAESWSELSWYDKIFILRHNSAYYGDEWLGRFMREFVHSQPPQFRHAPPRPRLNVPEDAIDRALNQ